MKHYRLKEEMSEQVKHHLLNMWRAAFLTVALYKLQTFQQKLDMFGGNVDHLEMGYKDLMENAALADADDVRKQVSRFCPGVWNLCDNTFRSLDVS